MKQYLERFRAWWASLAERERRVLSSGAVAFALILAYLLVWEPLAQARRDREAALSEARALAVLLETLAAEQKAAGGGAPGATAGANQSLLAVVDQSHKASALKKPWSQLRPEGDTTVRISFEDVPFDALLRWLSELQSKYGVRIDNADIERESGPGLVNARLTLMRG